MAGYGEQGTQEKLGPDPEKLANAWRSTLLYCGFSFPFFLFALVIWKDLFAIVVAGFFAAVGVGYLAATIRMQLGLSSPGEIRLRVKNPRPVPGGKLTAAVILPEEGRFETVTADFSCWHIDEHSKLVKQLWSGRQSVEAQRRQRGAIAQIAIDIPAGLPPTALPASQGGDARAKQPVKWELRLAAEGFRANSYQVLVGAEPGGAPATAQPKEPSLDTASLWVLVAANLVPIAGALFWGWHVEDMVYLYWIENVVIGAFTILRFLVGSPDVMQFFARGGVMLERDVSFGSLVLGKTALIVFFVLHYGAFCFGHLVFLGTLFPPDKVNLYTILTDRHALIAVAAMVASHGFSFLRNYLGRGEYRHSDFMEMMVRPYKRIWVTHIFILAGGLVLRSLKLPLVALVVFVAIKIYADVHLHRAERKALAPKGS